MSTSPEKCVSNGKGEAEFEFQRSLAVSLVNSDTLSFFKPGDIFKNTNAWTPNSDPLNWILWVWGLGIKHNCNAQVIVMCS